MENENLYLGIDLGTTNSVLAWGRYVRRTNSFEPEVVKIEHLGAGRKSRRSDLLPSVVYFAEGEAPYVGEYARSEAFTTQPGLVVRSVKSSMGNGKNYEVGRQEFTPAYISHLILNQIRAATKDQFGFEAEEVIITVPASFDSDMRADTIEAARLAGFKVTNDDGTKKEILLDEPRAALHYLIYKQQMDEISPRLIDLSTTKTILIFDLGGGTLDVSLHKVKAYDESFNVDVEDIAISRYTRIGGDNFDELLAIFFQNEFEAKYRMQVDDIPEDYIRHEIKSKLLLEAEIKKREINDLFSQGLRQKATMEMLKGRRTIKIQIPNLFDNKPYSRELEWDEIEEIISPLLGHKLSLQSLEQIDKLESDEANNIIYPILDVLNKAKTRLGKVPDIDAVFLNGGMTRFIPVKQRLTDFFGMEPLTVLDPDVSVAKGASVYHYVLHEEIRTKPKILAESIGIETKGGYVKHLVHAGTVLPTPKPITFDDFIVPEGITQITIPFYRGEGKEPKFPNVQLLERVIDLPIAPLKDEPLIAEVLVDANKLLTFHGWLESDPNIRIEVSVQSSDVHRQSEPPTALEQIIVHPPMLGPDLDVDDSVEILFSSQATLESVIKNGIEADILNASNRDQFIQPISDELIAATPSEMLRRRIPYKRAILILGTLGSKYPEHPEANLALRALMKVSKDEIKNSEKNDSYMKIIVQMSLVSLGRLRNPSAETVLIEILQKPNAPDSVKDMALVALAKCSHSANAIATTSQYITNKKHFLREYASWALGKMGSRDNITPVPINLLNHPVGELIYQIKLEQKPSVLQMIAYALGEICDQRDSQEREVVSESRTQEVRKNLLEIQTQFNCPRKLSQQEQNLKNTIRVALDMIQGRKLAIEQEKVLLGLRSKLDDATK